MDLWQKIKDFADGRMVNVESQLTYYKNKMYVSYKSCALLNLTTGPLFSRRICTIFINGNELAKIESCDNEFPPELLRKTYAEAAGNLEDFKNSIETETDEQSSNSTTDGGKIYSRFGRALLRNRQKRSTGADSNNMPPSCSSASAINETELSGVVHGATDSAGETQNESKLVSRDEIEELSSQRDVGMNRPARHHRADEPYRKSQCSGNRIGDDNIGFQMIKKIGWTGGPLGAKSNGIEEPVG